MCASMVNCRLMGGGPRVVVSTAAFHARVRGSVPGLGGLKETKLFLSHPRVKVSIVGSLRDREVACSASDRQGSNFESCVWRTVSSQSSHHPQEVLLAQFSLYVHKGGLKPDSFHFFCCRFIWWLVPRVIPALHCRSLYRWFYLMWIGRYGNGFGVLKLENIFIPLIIYTVDSLQSEPSKHVTLMRYSMAPCSAINEYGFFNEPVFILFLTSHSTINPPKCYWQKCQVIQSIC